MVAVTGVQNGKRWHLAPTLVNLVEETDRLFPGRSIRSDGSIGDAAHQARKSDHNPGTDNVVEAVDITDDDAHGCNVRILVNHLVAVRDERVKYLIHEGKIVTSYGVNAWKWVKYNGLNGHFQHAHVSILNHMIYAKGLWWPTPSTPKPTPKPEPTTKKGKTMIFAVVDVGKSFVIMPDGPVEVSEATFWDLAPHMQVVPMKNAQFQGLVKGRRYTSFNDTPIL